MQIYASTFISGLQEPVKEALEEGFNLQNNKRRLV